MWFILEPPGRPAGQTNKRGTLVSDITSIGFIGLGNVGSKLAGALVRNGYRVTVQDLNRGASDALLEDSCGTEIRAPGFPVEILDEEPESPGYEAIPLGRP